MKKPYIIAELSGNHNGDIHRAFQLMEEAKKAGADAVKLQTYTADTLTLDCDRDDFIIKHGQWANYRLYDLYKEAHTPWDWHSPLFAQGKKLGISVFSTPFDETAVDFLEQFDPPFYKIASFELTHHPLLAYIAKLKKPVIMSTGMASLDEITQSVDVLTTNGCNELILLHCVSAYPASIAQCNLATMCDLKQRFPNCAIGLSDHTLGITVAISAAALGAAYIEKHVTLKRSDGGIDSSFSLEPHELKQLCEETRNAALALGTVNYQRSNEEHGNKLFRRSIYATKDIAAGERLTEENIKIIRPGFGAEPKYWTTTLGSRARQGIKYGTPIDTSLLDSD